MKQKSKKKFKICAAFDTETCNVGSGADTRAYVVLYIVNDLRGVDLATYEPGNDDISLFRYDKDILNFIEGLIDYGFERACIPVVTAYNLGFDVQSLLASLNERHEMRVSAQSSTNLYTLDIIDDAGDVCLRFWDMFHLENNGLAAMGEVAGLPKAKGDWDYDLIRTPETPLSAEEIHYAARDVQVLPAYLKYLLNANEWLNVDDLGYRVITKTSLVRQMARNEIAPMLIDAKSGRKVGDLFEKLCMSELPKDFETYALRKSCFRGGLTFTAGKTASKVVENVASLDVTSMHHAFINGRYIPTHFRMAEPRELAGAFAHVLSRSISDVLGDYAKPFKCAFHAKAEFTNLRIKAGSAFDDWKIATLASAKFKTKVSANPDSSIPNIEAENSIRALGFHDKAYNPVFAFGKLIKADSVIVNLNEVELWITGRVYEWDSVKPLQGELSVKFALPPDYVTLQSNLLFERKSDAKAISKTYDGTPYVGDIPNSIPDGIKHGLRDGTITKEFFESWYGSTVKGQFNAIYGTQAQDVFRPDYMVHDGEFLIDVDTKLTPDNFDDRKPGSCKVLYTYGMRIVAGSRMHLVIAMELLHAGLGGLIDITGGDTDSLKIRCDECVSDDDLLSVLRPLHEAVGAAINQSMRRVRASHSEIASSLSGVGEFDIESCGGFDRWWQHVEYWNKSRASVSKSGEPHVTCAGLSRPPGEYNIETYIGERIAEGEPPGMVLLDSIGYNVLVPHSICHMLEHRRPLARDRIQGRIKDHTGKVAIIDLPQAQALYPANRLLGDTGKRTNADNVEFLKRIGTNVDVNFRVLGGG